MLWNHSPRGWYQLGPKTGATTIKNLRSPCVHLCGKGCICFSQINEPTAKLKNCKISTHLRSEPTSAHDCRTQKRWQSAAMRFSAPPVRSISNAYSRGQPTMLLSKNKRRSVSVNITVNTVGFALMVSVSFAFCANFRAHSVIYNRSLSINMFINYMHVFMKKFLGTVEFLPTAMSFDVEQLLLLMRFWCFFNVW